MCDGCCSAQSAFKQFKPVQQSRQQGLTVLMYTVVTKIVMCNLGTISTQCQSQITKKSGKTWCGMPQEAIFHRPSNKVLQWVLILYESEIQAGFGVFINIVSSFQFRLILWAWFLNWRYEGAQVQQTAAVSHSLNSQVRGCWDVSLLHYMSSRVVQNPMYPVKLINCTPSISEIIWVRNVRAIVVCGFFMKSLKKHILKI